MLRLMWWYKCQISRVVSFETHRSIPSNLFPFKIMLFL